MCPIACLPRRSEHITHTETSSESQRQECMLLQGSGASCAQRCTVPVQILVFMSLSPPLKHAPAGVSIQSASPQTRRASDSHVKRSVPCLMAPCKSGLTYMCTWGHALACSLACIRLRGLWSSGWREMILLKGAVRCSGGRNETAFSPATARVLFTPEWTRQGPSGGRRGGSGIAAH